MKKLLIAVSALASAMALGAAEYSSFSFSTVGPDKYADGETVMDGECYALVWSKGEGGFAGFNYDGTVKDPANSALMIALPLAEGGKCKPVVFNIEDGVIPDGAELGIYLLDTRKFTDGVAAVQGLDANGKLTFLNASEKIDAEVVASGTGATAPAGATAKPAGGTGAVASAVSADVPSPVITKLAFVGDSVVLSVAKTVAGINYQVVGGVVPNDLKPLGGEIKCGGAEVLTLSFPNEIANLPFIKVIRK